MSVLIVINFKGYGGFYITRLKGWSFRICLGWIAITFFKKDIENVLQKVLDLRDDDG